MRRAQRQWLSRRRLLLTERGATDVFTQSKISMNMLDTSTQSAESRQSPARRSSSLKSDWPLAAFRLARLAEVAAADAIPAIAQALE